MPGVGKKKFPYTKQGMAAAKSYAKRTGQPIKKYQGGGIVEPLKGTYNLAKERLQQHNDRRAKFREMTLQMIDSRLDSLNNQLNNIPQSTNPHQKRIMQESIKSQIDSLTGHKNLQIFGDKYSGEDIDKSMNSSKLDALRSMIPKFQGGGPVNTDMGNTPADLEVIKQRMNQINNNQQKTVSMNNAENEQLARIDKYKSMKEQAMKKAIQTEKNQQVANSKLLQLYTNLITNPSKGEIKNKIQSLMNNKKKRNLT